MSGRGRARLHPDADLPGRWPAVPRCTSTRCSRAASRRSSSTTALRAVLLRARRATRPRCAVARRVSSRPTLRTFAGEPVSRVEVGLPRRRAAAARAASREAGVECFEADLRFAYRYLIDRGIRGAFTVDGAVRAPPGRRPRLPQPGARARATSRRALRVLVVRHRDEPRRRAGSTPIAMAGAGGERVLMVGARAGRGRRGRARRARRSSSASSPTSAPSTPTCSPAGTSCDFDLHGAPARLPPRRAALRARADRRRARAPARPELHARVARRALSGRVVLDGLALLRSAFIRLDDYRLETAAQTLLGKRQADRPGAPRRARSRPPTATTRRALAAYNLEDARLVLEILARTGLVELAVRRSLADRHAARPRERADRVGRLALPAARCARAAGSRRRCVRPRTARRHRSGRPRARLAPGPLPQHPRLRLQEPVPEPHPHLQHRSADATCAGRGADARSIRTPGGAAFRRDEPGILPGAGGAPRGDERARRAPRATRSARRRSRS